MTQSNLPKFIKYSNCIKEVTIRKCPGINLSESTFHNHYEYYYISFIEVIETEIEIKKLLWTKIEIQENENKHIVPFSFKTYEAAKDFAQYLPGMSIGGYRFSKDFIELGNNISYETFKIKADSINAPIYIKFTDYTSHPRTYKKKRGTDDLTQYYGNDLDQNREPSGEFWPYNKLVVDYFFTDLEYNTHDWNIITNAQYENINDIAKYENENTHKFILMEK